MEAIKNLNNSGFFGHAPQAVNELQKSAKNGVLCSGFGLFVK